MDWTDKLWHQQRNMSTFKTIHQFYVKDEKVFAVMQRLLLFNGPKALHDSPVKLEAIIDVMQKKPEDVCCLCHWLKLG